METDRRWGSPRPGRWAGVLDVEGLGMTVTGLPGVMKMFPN